MLSQEREKLTMRRFLEEFEYRFRCSKNPLLWARIRSTMRRFTDECGYRFRFSANPPPVGIYLINNAPIYGGVWISSPLL